MIESHTTTTTASDTDAGFQHFATTAAPARATATTYRAVMLTRKSTSLDVLQIVELPVVAPGPGQLRVRVLAVGVGATDLMMLGGYRYAPKIPFVPGYEIAGVVDAVGSGVQKFRVGDRVAA